VTKQLMLIGALTAFAAPAIAADDPIAVRQALMRNNGAAAAVAGAVGKGELDYSPIVGRSVIAALEKEAVLVSLGNLLTFPFVRAAVEEGRLQLHGAWKDIRDGGLEAYDPATAAFLPL
jgi:carbonic anhydrase